MAENTFGARVAALRERLDLTQQDLGARGGLSRTETNKIEHGRNQLTVADKQEKLAACFGMDRGDLMDYLEGRTTLEQALALHDSPPTPPPKDVTKNLRALAAATTDDPAPSPSGTNGAALVAALGRAFRSGEYELADVDAVRAAVGQTAFLLAKLPGVDATAKALLDGAELLRSMGMRVSMATLMWAIMPFTRETRERAFDKLLNDDAIAELRELGAVPPEHPVRVERAAPSASARKGKS